MDFNTMDKEALKAWLMQKRQDYYAGEASVTDSVYDSAEDIFKSRFPNDPDIEGVRFARTTPFEKLSHNGFPMGSLNKANAVEDLVKFRNRVGGYPIHVSDKVDGLSLHLTYEDGILTHALTRHDGIDGEDVTHNVMRIPSIPKKLPEPVSVDVRGEVYLKKSGLIHFPDAPNTRNIASGTLRSKNGAGCEFLSFMAYEVRHL